MQPIYDLMARCREESPVLRVVRAEAAPRPAGGSRRALPHEDRQHPRGPLLGQRRAVRPDGGRPARPPRPHGPRRRHARRVRHRQRLDPESHHAAVRGAATGRERSNSSTSPPIPTRRETSRRNTRPWSANCATASTGCGGRRAFPRPGPSCPPSIGAPCRRSRGPSRNAATAHRPPRGSGGGSHGPRRPGSARLCGDDWRDGRGRGHRAGGSGSRGQAGPPRGVARAGRGGDAAAESRAGRPVRPAGPSVGPALMPGARLHYVV